MGMQLYVHTCVHVIVCVLQNKSLLLDFLSSFVGDAPYMSLCNRCSLKSPEMNFTKNNSSTSPSHTLPTPLRPPPIASWSGGDQAGDPVTETFPDPLLCSLHHTHATPQPDIPVLSQRAGGCRAREQEAPPLGQLFQTHSPPWAPHSLIQGSFVVLTSWNS